MYVKNNLIDSDYSVYLALDSLTDISNTITGLSNIILRKINFKPCRYKKNVYR